MLYVKGNCFYYLKWSQRWWLDGKFTEWWCNTLQIYIVWRFVFTRLRNFAFTRGMQSIKKTIAHNSRFDIVSIPHSEWNVLWKSILKFILHYPGKKYLLNFSLRATLSYILRKAWSRTDDIEAISTLAAHKEWKLSKYFERNKNGIISYRILSHIFFVLSRWF